MKPYGNSRRDNLTCKYGCCRTKYLTKYYRNGFVKSNYFVIKRSRKKKARQLAKINIKDENISQKQENK